ncbi:putative thymidylate kinase [Myxococcus xanthus DK 1622]|uniref:Thymidylate kinase n=1 Tax=Myxococcus xanthus (strain DK1622) TaxID=246197 RepID=Q1D972_MYXXD|nr:MULTISPECIES: dTMP kinase [Myxococcus]ABF86769.1 putative thymidylate kinase [Myxococcus xanthus DK 1622]NOJ57982.1 dTMP kinase [Myxococcus xanthus]QPM82090.1 dTMP kinase [Myxococcus xanthus]QVW71338.1 dTMP kinase [Myxococcus xanthus DZ2]QZZ50308.1 Thymidylate kinase [Myxococcus xanthus]
MFIDFEGIDGSGKTTLSNLLAAKLKRLGYRVAHAREGGELQAPAARRIRELTRDSRLLEMSPRTEFFLNLARDAQQLDEVVAPALSRGEVCITDRYLYSQLALSGGGRGLPMDELRPACELASQGLWPDLVILVDVDPDLARLRKRLGKLQSKRVSDGDSRKGLVGAGLAVRVRESFLEMARKDPQRWIILENNDVPLRVLEQRLVDAVVARLEGREQQVQRIVPAPARPRNASPTTLENLEERFFQTLDTVEQREPALAVWMLSGIPGLAAHQKRLAFAERFPGLTARGMAGLADVPAMGLREVLADLAPAEVAFSLTGRMDSRAAMLRQRLYAQAPTEVLASLKNDGSTPAWALRERAMRDGRLADVLAGLAGQDCEESWLVREAGMQRKLFSEVASSLTSVPGARADALREVLLPHDRLAVLRSTLGLDTPVARGLREALAGKALKLVLRSLTGLDTEEAWTLRERGAPQTKEALDSVDGMDGTRAWKLRVDHLGRWPTTALSSLKGLPMGPHAQALIERVLAEQPDRLPVLRNAYAVAATARALAQQPARTVRVGTSPRMEA